MPLQLEGYALLPDEDAPAAGAPLQIAIEAIDEDPEQPRQEFDAAALEELATTIRARGVRQPISVRPHPEEPGRWMLNFGARRLRASKLAERSHVPAFVDHAVDSYDQVIENEQREGLQPLELALFVQRRMAAGETPAEIARRLGKSRGYLTFVGALIDAPDWLMALYRSGRCRGLAELYELRRLRGSEPAAVERWLEAAGKVTRGGVQGLKESLEPSRLVEAVATAVADEPSSRRASPEASMKAGTPRAAIVRAQAVTLWGRCDDGDVIVDFGAVPEREGFVYVVRPEGTERVEVEASRVRLLRITRSVV
ncbi:ParB/RepB/Spo0J family partition protein [Methylibium sp. Root1272]|uniref:ParB/RepB/Spo0J family partition protein n=1 Tax=Methylibium sp. Root1272 TaxID=1736441 RepID=UPI0006F9FE5B|nr:ParB/RepB/Spo0J family partition protein [Methylibium sp. Root1272]KQW69834.1 hypothetical protein ASC67_04930 [Methylibium sp. Root1272]